jgi:hypothetical protein
MLFSAAVTIYKHYKPNATMTNSSDGGELSKAAVSSPCRFRGLFDPWRYEKIVVVSQLSTPFYLVVLYQRRMGLSLVFWEL